MRERDIFIEALRKDDPAEQAAYLASACSQDGDLLGRVERLLAEHQRSETFLLDSPPPGLTIADDDLIHPRPGTQIGPYRLLEQIGEGGMGFVYRAEQKEPVERQVALKIIKPGMDTQQVLARFEAERQALALMDHPNIARVLDAGTVGEVQNSERRMQKEETSPRILNSEFCILNSVARPYFVMELVGGEPISRYCDNKQLDVRQRLELMIPVCQAIQHAHQKGIIHRDIKPSNILVAECDGRPIPKVIDFGVAKAIATRSANEGSATWTVTHLGQIIGTPEYMSPEQAGLSQHDIDTRSDVYSLGVLLYELLTGSTPFDKHSLQTAAFHEVLRMIREDEPPRPSMRLSRVGSAHRNQSSRQTPSAVASSVDPDHHGTRSVPNTSLASIAAVRRTEPARLAKTMRGELDWIVMKALEKERDRRYETAESLAADLARYLNDEPVLACPPSAAYRFRKFARRNKVALTTTILVAVALIIGTAASTWQAIRATRAEAREKQNEARALAGEQNAKSAAEAEAEQRRRAEQQTREVERQRQRLESNERINALVTDQILSILKDNPAPAAKRQALLVTLLSRLDGLEPAERAKAFHRAGIQFAMLNENAAAISAYSEGLSLHPNHSGIYISRGDVYFRQGDFERAKSDYSTAIASLTSADPAAKELPYGRRGLAWSRLNQYEQALADFRASYEAAPAPTLRFLEASFRSVTNPISTPFDQPLHVGVIELFDRYVEDTRGSSAARIFAADSLAELKLYEAARRHLEADEAAGTPGNTVNHRLALLALQRGDAQEYRRICQAALAWAGLSKAEETSDLLDRATHLCTFGPNAFDDYTPVVALARRSLARQSSSAYRRYLLGAALFRRGRHLDEAHQWLLKSKENTHHSDGEIYYRGYLLALIVDSIQGRHEEALSGLKTADKNVNSAPYYNWRFQQVAASLRQEAMQLIDPRSPDGNQPASKP